MKLRKLTAAVPAVLAFIAVGIVYLAVRLAIAAGLDTGEVVAVALLPLALLGVLTAATVLGAREARDRIAAIVAHEVQRTTSDADVSALRDTVWPTAADAQRVEPHPFAELHTRVLEPPPRPGRHRSDVLADTAEINVAELLDDTMPKLYTHNLHLFGGK